MTARWSAFGLWAAVAASVVFWAFKLFVPAAPAPAHATVAATAASPRGDLRRLFGTDPVAEVAAAPPPSSRFQLIGVVAPRGEATAHEGLALIAVDGKPPKTFRVGAVVEGSTVLQAVRPRGATLGARDGVASVSLDIPPPLPAATGALPAAGQAPNPVPSPTPPVMRPLPGGFTVPARPLAGQPPAALRNQQQQPPNEGQPPGGRSDPMQQTQ